MAEGENGDFAASFDLPSNVAQDTSAIQQQLVSRNFKGGYIYIPGDGDLDELFDDATDEGETIFPDGFGGEEGNFIPDDEKPDFNWPWEVITPGGRRRRRL